MRARIDNLDYRLRNGHTAPMPVAEPIDWHPWIPIAGALGYKKFGSHKPKLSLSDYIDTAQTQSPAAVTRRHVGWQWPMLANDRLGDCVCAMILHAIQDFHLEAGTAVPAFTDDDAIALYEKIGGYKPGDPNTDGGCDENIAMKNWADGLPKTSDDAVHQIVGTVAVDPQNLTECRIAIDEFVNLLVGIALPQTAQGQSEWTVVGDPGKDPASEPGSWGGHGIPFREYDPETFKCVTWGAELLLTVPFHQAYTDEAHVVVTKEMLNNQGAGPSGVQWSDLVSDLGKLTKAQAKDEEPESEHRPRSRSKAKPKAEDKGEPEQSAPERSEPESDEGGETEAKADE